MKGREHSRESGGTTGNLLGAGFSKPAGGPLLRELLADTKLYAEELRSAEC
jgi:hypothetical protein